jgi:predicted aminopeptidase
MRIVSAYRPHGALNCVLFAVSCLLLNACAGPSYYAQAISGHFSMMGNRQDISELLESGTLDPKLESELRLSRELLEFAATELNLPNSDSYTQFVRTGQDAITWNVIAAPEFSLTPKRWCFLGSGCVPYRGYFKQPDAEKFAARLAKKDFDTTVSPAIAYSTLGWFDDPLLDTMLQYNEEQLAAFIFHELAHQRLYVKGDTAFNEAYASFIEEVGVRRWLESTGQAQQLVRWQKQEKASLQLNGLLQETRAELATVYSSGQQAEHMKKNKDGVFNQMRADYQALVEQDWEGESLFPSLLVPDFNNARLALINAYQGGACAFENLYRSAGRDMSRFNQLAAGKAALDRTQRSSWLNQPCEVIASNSDL